MEAYRGSEKGGNMTNQEVADCMNKIHGVWWKKYRDVSPVTDKVLDKAYEEGVKIVNQYPQTNFAARVFAGYMDVLNFRSGRPGGNI